MPTSCVKQEIATRPKAMPDLQSASAAPVPRRAKGSRRILAALGNLVLVIFQATHDFPAARLHAGAQGLNVFGTRLPQGLPGGLRFGRGLTVRGRLGLGGGGRKKNRGKRKSNTRHEYSSLDNRHERAGNDRTRERAKSYAEEGP
jgi:hypothetical protein